MVLLHLMIKEKKYNYKIKLDLRVGNGISRTFFFVNSKTYSETAHKSSFCAVANLSMIPVLCN